MLQKITKVYAHHGLPLECDIYTVADPVPDAPVTLFFHAGALTGWGRDCVPPWLVQVRLESLKAAFFFSLVGFVVLLQV